MPPRKQPAGTPSRYPEASASANDEIRALRAAVERLADEVRIMREVVDECRECFEWGVRNDKFGCEPRHVVRVTSMAKDPCDPEWREKLNAVPPAELERLRAAATGAAQPPATTPARQPELF